MKRLFLATALTILTSVSAFSQQRSAENTYNARFPFYTYYDYSWSVSTYSKQEVAQGAIGGISLSLKDLSAVTLKNCEVYLASVDAVPQDASAILGMTKVFAGDITMNGKNMVVNFNTPFQFDGQYLMVYFVNNSNSTVFPSPEFLNKTDENAHTIYNYSVFGNTSAEIQKSSLKPVVEFMPAKAASTNELSTLSKATLYPNPVNSTLYIDNKENASVRIYNSVGALVLSANQDAHAIDLSEFKAGLYFVELMLNNERVIRQITKE